MQITKTKQRNLLKKRKKLVYRPPVRQKIKLPQNNSKNNNALYEKRK